MPATTHGAQNQQSHLRQDANPPLTWRRPTKQARSLQVPSSVRTTKLLRRKPWKRLDPDPGSGGVRRGRAGWSRTRGMRDPRQEGGRGHDPVVPARPSRPSHPPTTGRVVPRSARPRHSCERPSFLTTGQSRSACTFCETKPYLAVDHQCVPKSRRIVSEFHSHALGSVPTKITAHVRGNHGTATYTWLVNGHTP
jgi:hypothetical protein